MKDLVVIENKINEVSLTDVKPEYKVMMSNIDKNMPQIKQASSNFYKSHSQFMNVSLDVTAITPVRSIKHTLAEIDKTRLALREAHIKRCKSNVRLRKKQEKFNNCKNLLNQELLEIEIFEIQSQLVEGQNAIEGAIRKLNMFVNQYESLLKHLGISEITEEMYEKEEARYHVMTVMKQALSSARTKGGIIDEGNHVYLFDLGINGATAQVELFNYLKKENEMIAKGEQPTHEMTMQWLEECADKFCDETQKFVERRGFKLLDDQSLTNTPRLASVA
tara:strand:- start:76 stop:906 length:831 start_codon:yes stop_codon:yes gene_type:complete